MLCFLYACAQYYVVLEVFSKIFQRERERVEDTRFSGFDENLFVSKVLTIFVIAVVMVDFEDYDDNCDDILTGQFDHALP